MKRERVSIAAVLILAMMISTSNGQGLLGRFLGGGGCDAGCSGCAAPACGAAGPSCGLAGGIVGPSCGVAGCTGCSSPSCGAAAFGPGCGVPSPTCGLGEVGCGLPGMPSCGMAGGLLNKFKGMFGGGMLGGGPGCGLPEPSCGSTGLGYGGGFGLCGGCGGGGCDSCGIGGYFGRNLHPVNPCACGGSLFGDCARGFLSFFDRAVGTLAGSFFGGLQAASAHCSGTFATLQSVASCGMCGSSGCDGGCAGGGCATGGCATGLLSGGTALGACGNPLGCSSPGCAGGCAGGGCAGCASNVVSAPISQGYVTAPAGANYVNGPPPIESYPATSYGVQSAPIETPIESYPVTSYPTESYSSSVVGDELYSPPAAPTIAQPAALSPIESAPIPTPAPTNTMPTEAVDPFVDDPTPLSQGRPASQLQATQPRKVAGGFRLFKSGNPHRAQPERQVASGYQFAKPAPSRPATGYQFAKPTPPQKVPGTQTQPVRLSSKAVPQSAPVRFRTQPQVAKANVANVGTAVAGQKPQVQPATAVAPLQHRYLQARGHRATLRR